MIALRGVTVKKRSGGVVDVATSSRTGCVRIQTTVLVLTRSRTNVLNWTALQIGFLPDDALDLLRALSHCEAAQCEPKPMIGFPRRNSDATILAL
jgi:hypothetical protein